MFGSSESNGRYAQPLTDRRTPPRILVVEDQDDVRQMLVTALQMEGHEVEEASTALEGLSRLRAARYNLVLSDYAMPGGTGAWMLNEATTEGLLTDTAALLVTAHPDVRRLPDVEVITKPVELDKFLRQVQLILAGGSGPADRAGERSPDPIPRPTPAPRVELVLYISSASPASTQAKRNLSQLLEEFEPSQVSYTIVDLVCDPLAGDADRIAFTPTLVKRAPEPRMWIVGNLREPEVVADILRACGVEAREQA